MTLAGIVAGLARALALTRLMGSLLCELQPTDQSTFAVGTLLLATTALRACSVPALITPRVDPIVAVRHE